jgi:hypothetical protein
MDREFEPTGKGAGTDLTDPRIPMSAADPEKQKTRTVR